MNLLTLDRPKDKSYEAEQSAKYLCYTLAGGDYEASKRYYEDVPMSELWEYFRIKLADNHGKNAVNS